METIRSLIRAVEKVGDSHLRREMLGKVTEVQNKLFRTREQLQAKQAELDCLRARLDQQGNHEGQRAAIFYDPPI